MALVAAAAGAAGGVCDFSRGLFLSPLCSMTSDLELDGFHLTSVAQGVCERLFRLVPRVRQDFDTRHAGGPAAHAEE